MSKTTHEPQPITDVARELGLPDELVETYGRGKAKIDLAALEDQPPGAEPKSITCMPGRNSLSL